MAALDLHVGGMTFVGLTGWLYFDDTVVGLSGKPQAEPLVWKTTDGGSPWQVRVGAPLQPPLRSSDERSADEARHGCTRRDKRVATPGDGVQPAGRALMSESSGSQPRRSTSAECRRRHRNERPEAMVRNLGRGRC